jgi:hypothetical protein
MAVFFSFHYERDAWRVQQILNMGALEERFAHADSPMT